MRTFLCVALILITASVVAAFYFGLCTISTEREERNYVVRLVVHPDFMVSALGHESARANGDDLNNLEAKGRIASVSPTKSEFVLTEGFKDMTFRVGNDTTIVINERAAKLADLKGGDEAAVVYTRQGQQLNASAVRCTRKQSSE